LNRHGDKGRPYTADVHQVTSHWEAEAGAFVGESYWEDKQMLRAGLKSALTLLRLFAGQLAQAVAAGLRVREGQDEGASAESP
jgi:hypothetical protein